MKTTHNKPQLGARPGRLSAKQTPAGVRSGDKATAFAGGMRATDAPAPQRPPPEPGFNYSSKAGEGAGAFDALTELGDGYAIVRLKRSRRQGEAYVRPNLPRIKPDAFGKVRDLLERIAASLPGQAAPVDLDSETLQAENESFSAGLQQEAMRWRARLLEEGKLLASAQLCQRQGVTRQSLSKAVADQRLFALDGPGGRKLYPAFFADATSNKRDLERATLALGALPGAVKWQFFTTPTHSLGGKTPVEALSKGQLDAVLRAATGFRERELGN